MKRLCLSLTMLMVLGLPLQAHFLYLVPDQDGKSAVLIFSDSLEPDRPELMAKITGTRMQFRPPAGAAIDLKWTDKKDAFLVAAPEGKPGMVTASLKYGVVAKGDDPFLLHYYATSWLPGKAAAPLPAVTPDEQMVLQIVPAGGRKFQVRWQGKPLADVTVAVLAGEKPTEVKTDAQGTFEVSGDIKGLCGLRVRQVEAKAGELDGKAYKEVRHYATLVVRLPG